MKYQAEQKHSFIDSLILVIAFVVIASVLLLTGCSTVDKYGAEAIDAIQQANDQALAAYEKAYCDGPTDGALARRYGGSTDIQEARNTLCKLIRAKHYSR